ncbi:uncharacterized protein FOBCDRAFT_316413 [Fusarium oxysporum Fo47]|uniref:Uncharacterized protein n=1 Tax=Fusarium oxysporum Fo47 TaxID=660027 RepID=W9KQD7_FUSOX|nr:uncharacterized protein FOBCDRAFT_316413 [Fusarium oxysporum Fo47]EWZ43383.1 hypothetical protein FOZG_04494 [Fusarium oxysporum Fo47]QKD50491.1 hypothetical protein FOBCDRAFT_316413 [Fusarium oxysporum Fo47]
MLSASQKLTAEERKERKRVQNRLNQRARRQRVKDEEDNSAKPFRVGRWRLDGDAGPSTRTRTSPHVVRSSKHVVNEGQALLPAERSALQSLTKVSDTTSRAPPALQPGSTHVAKLHLPADDALVHLIVHNVCRGFMENKAILKLVARFIDAAYDPPLPPDLAAGCGSVVLRTTYRTMPTSLLPTQLQMNSPHPSWIDMLPFPEIRDNLIRRQYTFDHKSFLSDLVGDSIYEIPSYDPGQEGLAPPPPPTPSPQTKRLNGHGLILWGEPYLKESWEATPQFLAKWAWVVEGCCDLVDASNGWRTTRGEYLLQTSGSG